MGGKWLVPLTAAATSFALADVVCDITIQPKEDASVLPSALKTKLSELEVLEEAKKEQKLGKTKDHKQLTAAQDACVASFVSFLLVILLAFTRTQPVVPTTDINAVILPEESASFSTELWAYKVLMPIVAGPLSFASYFFLLCAFESASSTVILPLVQLSSLWMLLGSSAQRYLMNEPWMQHPVHLLAYILILLGGLLPAAKGNLRTTLNKEFWAQKFVRLAVMSEVCNGTYNVLLSSYTQAVVPKGVKEAPTETTEFLLISRFAFVITAIIVYSATPFLRAEFLRLKSVDKKFILISFFGECLALSGYFLSSFAYQMYYQVALVHAAESSMIQFLNLLIAYTAKRFFNVGRESALADLRVKFFSFIFIASGLFCAAVEDTPS
eukprot:GILK01010194.1.p1 GENE.GILK01010194.1~~GILK01010194.1.p1  ORF type:complete len:383 (-),score=38.65 GILK01010194.1:98-1246(-)